MTRGFALRLRLGVCCLVFLAACASPPRAPDWQVNTHTALAAHVAAWLDARERVATQELATARREVARTGDASAMAKVELTACAARIASLSEPGCPAFLPLAADADAASRTYAAYLEGRHQDVETTLLPAAQQSLRQDGDVMPRLTAIEEPLSRLLGAALLLRASRLPPEGIALAIDTAARAGWRRPLLAWLGVERDRQKAAGELAEAEKQQRRMERILAAPAR